MGAPRVIPARAGAAGPMGRGAVDGAAMLTSTTERETIVAATRDRVRIPSP